MRRSARIFKNKQVSENAEEQESLPPNATCTTSLKISQSGVSVSRKTFPRCSPNKVRLKSVSSHQDSLKSHIAHQSVFGMQLKTATGRSTPSPRAHTVAQTKAGTTTHIPIPPYPSESGESHRRKKITWAHSQKNRDKKSTIPQKYVSNVPTCPPPIFHFRHLNSETVSSKASLDAPPTLSTRLASVKSKRVVGSASKPVAIQSVTAPRAFTSPRRGRIRQNGRVPKPSRKKIAADMVALEEMQKAENKNGMHICKGLGKWEDIDYFPSFLHMTDQIETQKCRESDGADLLAYERDFDRLLAPLASLPSNSCVSLCFAKPSYASLVVNRHSAQDWKGGPLQSLADAINLHPVGCLVNHATVTVVGNGEDGMEEVGGENKAQLDPSSSLFFFTMGGLKKETEAESTEGNKDMPCGALLEIVFDQEEVSRYRLSPGSLLRVGLHTATNLICRRLRSMNHEHEGVRGQTTLQQDQTSAVVVCFRALSYTLGLTSSSSSSVPSVPPQKRKYIRSEVADNSKESGNLVVNDENTLESNTIAGTRVMRGARGARATKRKPKMTAGRTEMNGTAKVGDKATAPDLAHVFRDIFKPGLASEGMRGLRVSTNDQGEESAGGGDM